jgi:hypothetical protein
MYVIADNSNIGMMIFTIRKEPDIYIYNRKILLANELKILLN